MVQRRRFRVSIRQLLILIVLVAIWMAYWSQRPEKVVRVAIDERGVTTVDGRRVALDSVVEVFESERRVRRWWLLDCHFELQIAPNVSYSAVSDLLAAGQEAGIESFSLAAPPKPGSEDGQESVP